MPDRIMAATAVYFSTPVISGDSRIRASNLQTVWYRTSTSISARAAAFGGTTTLVDFAIQAKDTKMRDTLDTWSTTACNMIVTDLPDAGMEDADAMVAEGVASFKLFMAYPGMLMVNDATIFKALSRTAKNGALISGAD